MAYSIAYTNILGQTAIAQINIDDPDTSAPVTWDGDPTWTTAAQSIARTTSSPFGGMEIDPLSASPRDLAALAHPFIQAVEVSPQIPPLTKLQGVVW